MSSSSTETMVDVTMPQMGVSVAEGTIVAWRVDVGDSIEAEATICEISTDKIDTEVPAPASGVVAEILVAVEETVTVGTVLARIDVGGGGGGGGGGVPSSANGAPDSGASSASRTPEGNGAAPAEPVAAAPAPAEPAAAAPAPAEPALPRPRLPRPAAPGTGTGTGARAGCCDAALLPGGPADRRRARHRPFDDRGHRARRPGAQAGRAGGRHLVGGRAGGGGAAAAHREPVPARAGGASSCTRPLGRAGAGTRARTRP